MDSSFSVDENGNRCPFKVPAPNATSTPRKQKQKPKPKSKYQCPQCGKEYQVKFYFDKHVTSHNSQVAAADANVSIAVHIDCSDLSFVQLQDDGDTSTTLPATNGVFKQPPPVPAAKKKVKSSTQKLKPQLICTYCLKSYICSKSYKNHVRAHHIQSAAAWFPNADEIMENSEDIADKALLSVATCPSVGESGAKFKELVGHLASMAAGAEWKSFCVNFCKELVDSIRSKKVLLPSALATTLLDKLEKSLSDDKFSDLIIVLNLGGNFDSDIISQFYLEFGLEFTTELLKFISSTFRKKSSNIRQCVQRVVKLDEEDRQVVYYIAGSIIRGYLKIARRSLKSKTWQSVAEVLKSKVLIDKPTGDIDPDSEWTLEVDRGELLFINAKTQAFFVKVTEVVYAHEKKDGSIDYEKVIESVSNSKLIVEWGDIITDNLEETVSINLMNDVILCLCRTCGRGFAKRRLKGAVSLVRLG